ncbi:COG4223 family protein [Rhodocista pekingensis]|uniref:Mitofilin family membrane protein n=1 Tax=Rhodocista pekingensis TaxID=201185 RepID=A0ABW2KXA8_9PROT
MASPASDHYPSPEEGYDAARSRATDSIIEWFGGVRSAAAKLGIPATIVQGWRKRGQIPESRREDLMSAAAAYGIPLTTEDLDRAVGPALEEPADLDPLDGEPGYGESGYGESGRSGSDYGASSYATDGTRDSDGYGRTESATEPEASPVTATPYPESPQPEVQRGGGGFVSTLALLLALGSAGVVGAQLYQPDLLKYLPGLPSAAPTADPLAETRASVTALQEENKALRRRIESLTADLRAVADRPPPAPPAPPAPSIDPAKVEAQFAELRERVQMLVTALEQAAAAPAEGGGLSQAALQPLRTDVETLAGRIEALESAPAPTPGADPAAVEDLAGRLEKTETALAEVQGALGEAQAAGGETAALREQVDALARQIADLSAAGDTSALREELEALGQQVTELSGAVQELAAKPEPTLPEPEPLPQELVDLPGRVDELATTLASIQTLASGEAVKGGDALVLVAAQLQSALASGRPYARELATARAISPEGAGLDELFDTLEARAAQGLPAFAALHESFRRLAPEVIRADRTRTDADWLDLTLGRLNSIITVRRASGDIAGADGASIVARAEEALNQGNLTLAVKELDALTGPAAAALQPWLADARSRVAAEKAAQALTDAAVTRIGEGGQ